jgi:hypothetical protein
MIRIHKFINEEDINYYKGISNDDIKKLIEKLFEGHREVIGLPNGDIDVLLEQFRENNFTEYRRKTEWHYTFTKVLDNDGTIKELNTKTARFDFINKWNQEEGWYQKYRIIVDDNMKILWIGRYNEKQYFISVGDKIYEIEYEHKQIKLFPNISCEDEYFYEGNNKKNDCLVKKYKENMGTYRYGTIDNVKEIFKKEKIGVSISVDEYFKKGFFYKGFKWNKNWNNYYGYDYITILIDIIVKNGLFCIEIENITYPFYGYLLLDLDKLEIVEAKKY